MKRKDYQKPTMNVVELQHKTQLLQASSETVGTQNYNWNEYDE